MILLMTLKAFLVWVVGAMLLLFSRHGLGESWAGREGVVVKHVIPSRCVDKDGQCGGQGEFTRPKIQE